MAAPDVAEELAERIPVSVGLALAGLFVAIVIGIPLGILAGMRPGGVVDRSSVTGTSFGLAIPNFVLGFFLIQVFALTLGWFPAQGYTKFSDDPSGWLESIILPAFALGVIAAASVARQTRAALIDVLQSNYVRTAFSVGTGTRRTVVKYAFKNASIPTVTVIGLQLAALIGGVVIIEQIFVIPGLGTYMLRALSLPDVPVIQAVDDHVRADLRDAQPDRRHQLWLPQPDVYERRERTMHSARGRSRATPSRPHNSIEDAGIALDEATVGTRTPSPWSRAVKRLLRDKPAMIALVFLLLIIFMAVFASLVAPHDPDVLGTPFETPSLDHPLGTDHNGRDTFSRIVYGGQVSLRSGFQIVGLAALIAVPLGLLAGFRGGGTDATLMRIMDGLSSFPPLVLALAVAGVLGADLENAILAISLVMIPGLARCTCRADSRGP